MKGDQVPFGWQLSEIKEKSFVTERKRELAPIHLPTNHRFLIFEVSHMFLYQKEKHIPLYMFQMFPLFQNNSKSIGKVCSFLE